MALLSYKEIVIHFFQLTKLPKRADINSYSQESIESIINCFNNRPMRCLEYRTPQEIFNENIRDDCGTIFSGVAFQP